MSKRYRVFNYVGGVLQKLVAKNRQENVDTVAASEEETDTEEGTKSEAPLEEEGGGRRLSQHQLESPRNPAR
jgi:hypothetical protein